MANLPLRLVMDNVIKVTFPSFSRLQDDRNALKLAIEKSLFLISLTIFPIAIGIICYSPFLMKFIPKYQKWEPAVISIMFFSLGTVLSSISTPLTNFLNAIGKVKVTLYFMIFWTIAIWVLTIPLITMYGYNGVAIASFLVSLTSIGVFYVSKKYVKFRVFGSIYKQFIAAAVMYVFAVITKSYVSSFTLMFIFAISSLTVYFLTILLIARKELFKTAKFVINSVRSH